LTQHLLATSNSSLSMQGCAKCISLKWYFLPRAKSFSLEGTDLFTLPLLPYTLTISAGVKLITHSRVYQSLIGERDMSTGVEIFPWLHYGKHLFNNGDVLDPSAVYSGLVFGDCINDNIVHFSFLSPLWAETATLLDWDLNNPKSTEVVICTTSRVASRVAA